MSKSRVALMKRKDGSPGMPTPAGDTSENRDRSENWPQELHELLDSTSDASEVEDDQVPLVIPPRPGTLPPTEADAMDTTPDGGPSSGDVDNGAGADAIVVSEGETKQASPPRRRFVMPVPLPRRRPPGAPVVFCPDSDPESNAPVRPSIGLTRPGITGVASRVTDALGLSDTDSDVEMLDKPLAMPARSASTVATSVSSGRAGTLELSDGDSEGESDVDKPLAMPARSASTVATSVSSGRAGTLELSDGDSEGESDVGGAVGRFVIPSRPARLGSSTPGSKTSRTGSRLSTTIDLSSGDESESGADVQPLLIPPRPARVATPVATPQATLVAASQAGHAFAHPQFSPARAATPLDLSSGDEETELGGIEQPLVIPPRPARTATPVAAPHAGHSSRLPQFSPSLGPSTMNAGRGPPRVPARFGNIFGLGATGPRDEARMPAGIRIERVLLGSIPDGQEPRFEATLSRAIPLVEERSGVHALSSSPARDSPASDHVAGPSGFDARVGSSSPFRGTSSEAGRSQSPSGRPGPWRTAVSPSEEEFQVAHGIVRGPTYEGPLPTMLRRQMQESNVVKARLEALREMKKANRQGAEMLQRLRERCGADRE
ncbi:uncharacterized protein B0H18DRAFT_962306 [Fomitopsis serialis]|uniref:uncharacterized protein n=1 Tax=Fomitopsis serialis TaxID=139415 RepID=UPI002008E08F|nr:uncharacterized protein B0H18DRAFT_962306 [Neoantrodia serialis]KAH9911345.1 hypothetical protein B0H18DRAFT_962306 [Neoantrodia serialis]